MKIFFLDVVDAGVSGGAISPEVIIVLLVTILIESVVLILMKYNRFKMTLLNSFIVNVASIAAGFILIELGTDLFYYYSITNILILFAISAVIEFFILYLLNKKLPVMKTLQAAVVMNLVSYFLFYSIQFFI